MNHMNTIEKLLAEHATFSWVWCRSEIMHCNSHHCCRRHFGWCPCCHEAVKPPSGFRSTLDRSKRLYTRTDEKSTGRYPKP